MAKLTTKQMSDICLLMANVNLEANAWADGKYDRAMRHRDSVDSTLNRLGVTREDLDAAFRKIYFTK